MNSLDQLKKANKRKDRLYKLTHIIDKQCAALSHSVGEELYGKPGDKFEIIQPNGTPGIAKILFTEVSMWTDIPRCIIEVENSFSGKYRSHINSPEKILRRL
jgi:hypothetical protein